MSIASSNKLRVKGLVYLLPGVHLRQLQRILGISFHSTRYHVETLSDSGEIVRFEEGRYSRLYPHLASEADRALYAFVYNGTSRKILKALSFERGLTNKQISKKTGLAKSTVSEHLQCLLDGRIVRISLSADVRVTYELRERDKVANLLKSTERTLMLLAVDRFVDLWDF